MQICADQFSYLYTFWNNIEIWCGTIVYAVSACVRVSVCVCDRIRRFLIRNVSNTNLSIWRHTCTCSCTQCAVCACAANGCHGIDRTIAANNGELIKYVPHKSTKCIFTWRPVHSVTLCIFIRSTMLSPVSNTAAAAAAAAHTGTRQTLSRLKWHRFSDCHLTILLFSRYISCVLLVEYAMHRQYVFDSIIICAQT